MKFASAPSLLILFTPFLIDASFIDNPGLRVPLTRNNNKMVHPRQLQDETSYDCFPTECSNGEFCGKDLVCHRFSCENWYAWGSPVFTGDGQNAEALSCQDIPPGEKEDSLGAFCDDGFLPMAVQFAPGGCANGGYSVYACPEPDNDPFARTNRKCTAQQSTGLFVCYDISPETDLDSYFAPYVEAAASIETTPCQGIHVYNRISTAHNKVLFLEEVTEMFNAPLAQASVVSNYYAMDPTAAPTMDPTAAPTMAPKSSAGVETMAKTAVIMSMLAVFLIAL